MKRMVGFLKLFRRDIIVMLLAVRHPGTPRKIKGLFIAAVLYLISPFDIVPDAIPLAGIVDDMVIVPMAVMGLMRLLPSHVRQESEAKAAGLVRHAPLLLGAASAVVLLWVALLVWGIWHLAAYLLG